MSKSNSQMTRLLGVTEDFYQRGDAMKRSLIVDTQANSCYFRTSVGWDGRKALIQITERCNLHCVHCFVSSGDYGEHMRIEDLAERVLPRLRSARVERITLTGGEPFAHPDLMDICAMIVGMGLPLGICTNATQTSDEQIAVLAAMDDVHVNVSFDGFRAGSHGKFRGNTASFEVTKETTRKFAAAGLLQGLLSTRRQHTLNPLAVTDSVLDLDLVRTHAHARCLPGKDDSSARHPRALPRNAPDGTPSGSRAEQREDFVGDAPTELTQS
jgi:sulfatase maturation enzyme AslB (radical SAM superfamily)